VIEAKRASSLEGRIVLVLDDHRIFAEVIALHLETLASPAELHLASGLDQARAVAHATRPDLVILDYDLDGDCGLDLIPELAKLELTADVIVLSASRDPQQIIEAFERGAQAWVDKTGRVDELLEAVTAVRAGDMFLSAASVRPVVDRQLAVARTGASAAGFAADCTERELEVLRHLMAGMTRPEVAAALGLSTNTVRTHVQNLLRTTEMHSTLALIAAAREAGLSPAPARLVPLT
jgi:DNA-binding NarL/FixJ family response regulator